MKRWWQWVGVAALLVALVGCSKNSEPAADEGEGLTEQGEMDIMKESMQKSGENYDLPD